MKTTPSKITLASLAILSIALVAAVMQTQALATGRSETVSNDGTTTSYPIVDTGQSACYDNNVEIACPQEGNAFYGQDAQVDGAQPSYTLGADGLTVYDNVTGLTWTQSPDLDGSGVIDIADKLTFSEAQTYADTTLNPQSYGGYDDWRLPTIKELYSLMDFRGTDPSGPNPATLVPFIDTDYFEFAYGDTEAGERLIDAQFWSSTAYVGTVFGSQSAAFGLNLADGRIKGYPSGGTGLMTKLNYVYFVRGNSDYGINDFTDNGDGTVTDSATGLMWSQDDSGPQVNPENSDGGSGPRSGMDWEAALAWVEQKNAENYLGYSDWRLPNAKEMQSILDYSQAPETTGTAAIDSIFNTTQITNENGEVDYPWFWTSTTHVRADGSGSEGAYICFGRCLGYVHTSWLDVHGAGAQRSDNKDGDLSGYTYTPDGYYFELSPQGDAVRSYNYVRLVRDAGTLSATPTAADPGAPTPVATSAASATTYLPQVLNDNSVSSAPVPSSDGYYLFAPLNSTTTYLVDESGQTVHTWGSSYRPGNAVYLLDGGHILRTGNTNSPDFNTGGAGGIVQEIDPQGSVLWEFEYDGQTHRLHHDVEVLPDGNVLMIAWELKTSGEAIDAGRDPNLLAEGVLWPDQVIEVDPVTQEIVWEWHVWDHLVQDYDPGTENYGVVADHPELIDLNFIGDGPPSGVADWNHTNAIDYNADLDQILLSVHNFSEVWVIDHSTTTGQAAGHSGGNSGKGGDLLYRWGNPQAYGAGNDADQQLFVQHDAQWIPDGYPGAGHILIFNNGTGRPDGNYSSVDEIIPPVDAFGNYSLVAGMHYGPGDATWSYQAGVPTEFYARNISGAQRLPDGNTLICNGPDGYLFEVTPAGEVVWDFQANGALFRATRFEDDLSAWAGMR